MIALLLDAIKYWKVLAGVGIVVVIILIWNNVSNAYEEAAKVPILELEIQTQKALLRETQEKCEQSKEPAKEANNYDKTHSNKLLAECIGKLRSKTCECVHVSGTSSGAKTAYDYFPALRGSEIEAHNIYCESLNNDLNTAKTWALKYPK